jgi:hypothetical protein
MINGIVGTDFRTRDQVSTLENMELRLVAYSLI